MEPTLRGCPWGVGGLRVQAAGVLGQSRGWCDAGSAPGLLRDPTRPFSQITACLSLLFQDPPSIPQTCRAWLIRPLGRRRQPRLRLRRGGSACSPGSWGGTQTLP